MKQKNAHRFKRARAFDPWASKHPPQQSRVLVLYCLCPPVFTMADMWSAPSIEGATSLMASPLALATDRALPFRPELAEADSKRSSASEVSRRSFSGAPLGESKGELSAGDPRQEGDLRAPL